ncbi:MAG: protease complex subunit PrcB family protein [Candidatus Thiodiazotropha sp.]
MSDSEMKQSNSVSIGDSSPKPSVDNNTDRDQFWIIRVNMGQQPSGGYGLRLLSEQLDITANTATVTLEWLQPKPGSVQMQALTYPCIYLKLAKSDYSQLEIADQEGEIRFQLNLN